MDGVALTDANVARALPQAIAAWEQTPLGASQADALAGASVQIADLPSGLLGITEGQSVYLSRDAAGFGWSPDRVTPGGGMDLLTVVEHELGHVLGLIDVNTATHPADIMADSLSAGQRRDVSDTIFSNYAFNRRGGSALAV